MAYYIDLFSPQTYDAFSKSDRGISGFRPRQRGVAASVRPGDLLLCYMTKLSRWVGVLEVTSTAFSDNTPVFVSEADPFTVRFRVVPRVWLPPEQGIPIQRDVCWNHLSFTRNLPENSLAWTSMVRGSLRRMEEADGQYLADLLVRQASDPRTYALTEADRKKLAMPPPVVNSSEGQIAVSVPEEGNEPAQEAPSHSEQMESIRIQAALAEMGEKMGFRIWLPRGDRQRVCQVWQPEAGNTILERLPLNYNDVTLQTIENIDVLWIRKRTIIRAFEVEHTTSIYSGILRMADLMALQPNLSIRAHIVAPLQRRKKVLQEISRPVFSLLEQGPMSERCTYISYDAVEELLQNRNLSHMNDSVLEEYEEYAEEADI